jgi:2-alkyl-3-oxoalkanoate reductase
MSERIAVLGAGGFIGNRTVEILHVSGADVLPIVRTPSSLALACRFDVPVRLADALDESALTDAFAGCDSAVIAIAGDARTIVGSIAPVYRAAESAGLRRLVYLSTASVHGQSPAPGTVDSTPLSDRQPIAYNNHKVRAERRLLECRATGSTEVVLLRPGIVYGPRSQWTGGLADDMLAGSAYLVDGGRGICNAIYVDNVVAAVRQALGARDADGRAFLIGDREEINWIDLYRPITEALGLDVLELPTPPASAAVDGARRFDRLRASPARRFVPRPVRAGLRAAYRATRDPRSIESGPASRSNWRCCTRARTDCPGTPLVPFWDISRRRRSPRAADDRSRGSSSPATRFPDGRDERPAARTTGVAVVITTYNHAHFLDDAITSVLSQSAPVDEIIVVDDGSTDHPERVTDRHRTVHFVRQRQSGLPTARNTGWRAATSDFVVFLDADDRLTDHAIEVNAARLRAHPEAAFSYGAYVNVRMDLNLTSAPVFPPACDGFADFLRGNPIGMHATVMYRRSAIAAVGGFADGLPACEDYDLYLRIASGHPVVHGDEVLAEYRHHGANMSRDSAMMLKAALDVLHGQKDRARSTGLLRAYREGVASWKRHYVRLWVRDTASAVRSRDVDVALARKGASVISMAPITVIRLTLDRLVASTVARLHRRLR